MAKRPFGVLASMAQLRKSKRSLVAVTRNVDL